MDRYHLNLDPWKLIEVLYALGYKVPDNLKYITRQRHVNGIVINADLELQPFESEKDGIALRIIPYSINDVGYSPRLVKTIHAEGISLDALIAELLKYKDFLK